MEFLSVLFKDVISNANILQGVIFYKDIVDDIDVIEAIIF